MSPVGSGTNRCIQIIQSIYVLLQSLACLWMGKHQPTPLPLPSTSDIIIIWLSILFALSCTNVHNTLSMVAIFLVQTHYSTLMCKEKKIQDGPIPFSKTGMLVLVWDPGSWPLEFFSRTLFRLTSVLLFVWLWHVSPPTMADACWIPLCCIRIYLF